MKLFAKQSNQRELLSISLKKKKKYKIVSVEKRFPTHKKISMFLKHQYMSKCR